MENEIQTPKGLIKPNIVEPPQKTYFFERYDGSIIHVQEREAWNLMKNQQRVVGLYIPPPKYIGCSDGTAFRQAVIEAHALHAEGRTPEAQARLRQGEAEELAAARLNPERPRNFDTVDANRQPFRR